MGIRGGRRHTFYISPGEGGCHHDRNSADFRRRHDSTLYRKQSILSVPSRLRRPHPSACPCGATPRLKCSAFMENATYASLYTILRGKPPPLILVPTGFT